MPPYVGMRRVSSVTLPPSAASISRSPSCCRTTLPATLQATEGCSYNQCSFCTFYRDILSASSASPAEHIAQVRTFSAQAWRCASPFSSPTPTPSIAKPTAILCSRSSTSTSPLSSPKWSTCLVQISRSTDAGGHQRLHQRRTRFAQKPATPQRWPNCMCVAST